MNNKSRRGVLTIPLLVYILLLTVVACAQDYGRDTKTDPVSSESSSATPSTQPNPAPSPAPGTTAQASDDIRFVAAEEQGNKLWKATPTPATINLKNRGNTPLRLKAVNTLPAEHGFAIDTMKVKEVIKPGEEITITVPMENIDPSVSEHRVYCQLHPKHVATTLVLVTDKGQITESAKGSSQSPSGETSLKAGGGASAATGETQGQRVLREQSEKQEGIETTSPNMQTPGDLAPNACAGFPGFDRGCPPGGK